VARSATIFSQNAKFAGADLQKLQLPSRKSDKKPPPDVIRESFEWHGFR
jgi:hypothetical protein